MKKALVIYNPVSGAKSWKNLPQIFQNELDKNGYTYEWFETKPVKQQWMKPLFENKFDRIMVVGGDGTVAEVAGVMIQENIKTPLVIIPRGSANLLSLALGIPQGVIRRAVRMGLQKPGRPIDVMRINRKFYALNAVGKGYDVFVMKNTPRHLKRKWGFLAYAHTVFRTFFPYRRRPYQLTIDGTRRYVVAKSILIFNTFPIPGFKIGTPGMPIKPNDGLLNVVVFNSHFLRASTITAFTGKTISIKSKRDHEFDLDGEVLPAKTITIEVLPQAFNIVFPKSFK